ncbi:hypothetical protein BDY17DRAFT_348087 [Neohortaea acidophila]|uniref:Wax synthase domain-containing protein n=1 Tax=Neohortaea acidophila TaxID=245834 RepID=A0A6A6PKH3_9PEZI|nr:uncharacterized protein BDY17DRAFT_348087 [Neohortaea acidophila]KAF2480519.1 hypothetical protein BDY17DRAFT_348087 [Neohortaea acidophila]
MARTDALNIAHSSRVGQGKLTRSITRVAPRWKSDVQETSSTLALDRAVMDIPTSPHLSTFRLSLPTMIRFFVTIVPCLAVTTHISTVVLLAVRRNQLCDSAPVASPPKWPSHQIPPRAIRAIGLISAILTLAIPYLFFQNDPIIQPALRCVAFFYACKILDLALARATQPPTLLMHQDESTNQKGTQLNPPDTSPWEYTYYLLTEMRYQSFSTHTTQLLRPDTNKQSTHSPVWTIFPPTILPTLVYLHPTPILKALLALLVIQYALETLHTFLHRDRKTCTQPLFHTPFAAPSFGAFWSTHWHAAANPFLQSLAYQPVRTLSGQKAPAVLATFALTGIWHAWAAMPAVEREMQAVFGWRVWMIFMGIKLHSQRENFIKCRACGSFFKRVPLEQHYVLYHGFKVPDGNRDVVAYAMKYIFVGSTLPMHLGLKGTDPPTRIVVVFRISSANQSPKITELQTAIGLQAKAEKSVDRLRQSMGWNGPIETHGIFLYAIPSNLLPAVSTERVETAARELGHSITGRMTRDIVNYTRKLEDLINNGGVRPAIINNWDNCGANWSLFEEFAHRVVDFTMYTHCSNRRSYEVERTGLNSQQLLPRSDVDGYSLLIAETNSLKTRPLPPIDGVIDREMKRWEWQLQRQMMSDVDVSGWIKGSSTHGEDQYT